MQEWDAIVVGGSFAGLAAATELTGHGRVLVIDKDPVGDNQTSACATPVQVLERLGAAETICHVHRSLVLHLPGGAVRTYRPRYAFATFDYRALCHALARQTDATILQARVTGLRDGAVATGNATYHAPILIDASGWRGTLASSIGEERRPGWQRTNGLETVLPGETDGLHFWLGDRRARDGYLWDFPADGQSRIGLIRYRSGSALKGRLESFLEQPLTGSQLHGGVLPAALTEGVAGGIMVTGDAAGLCLPLTGEGIRPALVFGQLAGRLAARVLDGRLSLDLALESYRCLLKDRRFALKYGILSQLERHWHRMPAAAIDAAAWYLGAGPLADRCQAAYWRLAPAEWLRPSPLLGARRRS